MGFKSSAARIAGAQVTPRLAELSPGLTASFVREALHRAIVGVGPLTGAVTTAERKLREQGGDVDRGIHDLIETHVRLAGAQGFLTNLGGIAVATVAIPSNVTGLALVQSRMIAGIAHVRGYDLDDPRVRNAVLVALLGEDDVLALVKRKVLPTTPMGLAHAPAHDPTLDAVVSQEVAANMLARVAGKRMAGMAARRVPLVGGVVGAGADGISTYKVGRYADREFLPRVKR